LYSACSSFLSISSTNRSSSVTESPSSPGAHGPAIAESASSNCGHRKPARLDFICRDPPQPQRWWFYFLGDLHSHSLFLFFIQPLVIDPMFSKFEPLSAKAPELVPQLERITVRGGMPIPPERMFWMLPAIKTIYTNAYVTGIGATKRVVIWDTSLSKETNWRHLDDVRPRNGPLCAESHLERTRVHVRDGFRASLTSAIEQSAGCSRAMEIRGACARLTIGPLFRLCCCSSRSSVSRQMLSAIRSAAIRKTRRTFTVSK